MEPDNPDDRPESPKKKIRPSSTTNSEVSHSDSSSATGSVGTSDLHSGMNGGLAAPNRTGRLAEEAISSSETHTSNGPSLSSIADASSTPQAASSNQQGNKCSDLVQEEEVSSSENMIRSGTKPASSNEGNADSMSEVVLNRGFGDQMPERSGSEAERKEL